MSKISVVLGQDPLFVDLNRDKIVVTECECESLICFQNSERV